MDSLGSFNLISLIALGIALLVATAIVYGPERRTSGHALRRVLLTSSWFLIVSGILGVVVAILSLAAIPLVVITLMVLVLALRSYFRQERAIRLTQLAVASDARVSLVDVLAALGRESDSISGWKCKFQAERLAAGEPLVKVLRDSWDLPSRGATLAIGAGADFGDFAAPLQEALQVDEDFSFDIRDDAGRFFYLYWVVLVSNAVLTFFAIKIIPVFQKMLAEFDVTPGPSLQAMVTFCEFVGQYWYLAGPIYPLLLFVLFAGLLYFIDLWPSRFPGFSFFTAPLDRAWVLRGLTWGVRAGRPIPEILATLARHYPITRVVGKIDAAKALVDSGVSWIDALAHVRLLRSSDAAVLRAAERVGNLEWALREQAASNSRGWGTAAKRVLTATFPVLMGILGCLVLLSALALFETLAELITRLS